MKKLMLVMCVFVVALFTAGTAMAQSQDITGQWQGTLHAPGRDLRTILKISKAPDGRLAAVFYPNIDQGGTASNVSSVSIDGSTVKYAVTAINASFQGTISADGNTIDGKLTAGPQSLDPTLVRTTPDTAWAIPAPPKPMTATDPSFEVATIKLTPPDQPGKLFTVTPGGRQVLTKGTTMFAKLIGVGPLLQCGRAQMPSARSDGRNLFVSSENSRILIFLSAHDQSVRHATNHDPPLRHHSRIR